MKELLPLHGGQLRQISEHFGIPVAELLDLSVNVNPDGPSSEVLRVLRAGLDDLTILTQYPDLSEAELRSSLARYVGVTPGNIAIANGFVPLLQAALRTLSIRSCLLPVPAFTEYRKALSHADIRITPHVLTPSTNFRYDVEAMLASRHDAILLANPQNPSGVLFDREAMLDLITKAAEHGTYILLDEAFIDYAFADSVTKEVDRLPNLVVFRSITKFYGVPGLRVAYIAANSRLVPSIVDRIAPWPVTTIASRAAIAAVSDTPYIQKARSLNEHRRSDLQARLKDLGISTYHSAANFLLFGTPSRLEASVLWQTLIVEHRIVLRLCNDYEALAAGHLRAAVRDESINACLARAVAVVTKQNTPTRSTGLYRSP